ncbi:hypothetical protein EVAR_42517_1 [Eumeta japonica]|uniref:Uncharacterized protein n=1 Tax=Eumeta variegata TaxID=151549 RepID=A0A4C1XIS2_EUMVA|nr:hypothetical protein EVAR_42517_1 [Eumeta japonica]
MKRASSGSDTYTRARRRRETGKVAATRLDRSTGPNRGAASVVTRIQFNRLPPARSSRVGRVLEPAGSKTRQSVKVSVVQTPIYGHGTSDLDGRVSSQREPNKTSTGRPTGRGNRMAFEGISKDHANRPIRFNFRAIDASTSPDKHF